MHTEDIEYRADGARLVGQYVVDDGKPGKQPGVLVCHEGPGLTEHTKRIAARLAGPGYAAFAMDYHGDGKPLAKLADATSRRR
jgi:dienelactone hydrolase